MPSVRAPRIVGALVLAALVFLGNAAPVRAQGSSGVLTIDPERLFEETQFGLRVLEESEALASALQAENRRIEAELTDEERDLTERRATLPVDEFRALADAFDEKVDRIRSEQDQKAREIQDFREAQQQEFLGRIGPVLLELVRERQAAILLDRRAVFLSAGSVDITDAAITRIDTEIGRGTSQPE